MGLRGRHRARGLLAPAGVLAVAALVLLGGAALGVKGGRHHGRAAALNAPAQSSVRTARSNLDPKRVVALGAFIPGAPKDPERLVRYIRKTGQRPTIISYFRRWQHGTFDPPSLRTVTRNGAIPMITWEPWGYPLADIAAGRYDDFLRSVAAEARRRQGGVDQGHLHEGPATAPTRSRRDLVQRQGSVGAVGRRQHTQGARRVQARGGGTALPRDARRRGCRHVERRTADGR